MRIGLLGGTFDPPHLGHLILAQEALEQCSLDRILWLPAGDPPHKQGKVISAIQDRMQLVSLSIQGNEQFILSGEDADRPGPHFTADSLDLLASKYEGSDWFLLVGGDSFRDLPTWQEPHRIIEKARIIVMSRPGITYDIQALDGAIAGIASRTQILNTPLIDISARDIRLRSKEGRSIRYLVVESVRKYIIDHALYQSD